MKSCNHMNTIMLGVRLQFQSESDLKLYVYTWQIHICFMFHLCCPKCRVSEIKINKFIRGFCRWQVMSGYYCRINCSSTIRRYTAIFHYLVYLFHRFCERGWYLSFPGEYSPTLFFTPLRGRIRQSPYQAPARRPGSRPIVSRFHLINLRIEALLCHLSLKFHNP